VINAGEGNLFKFTSINQFSFYFGIKSNIIRKMDKTEIFLNKNLPPNEVGRLIKCYQSTNFEGPN
jgi:hypothetical protein